jgi:DNA-binding GntR family transcriptional regulator
MTQGLRVEPVSAPIRTQVVDNLRQAIINQQFAPGHRLIERELVELTGASRTSVREALRELTAEGLVKNVPNRGTVIAQLSAVEARELYQVRSALEGLAGRLFVLNGTAEDRARLHEALAEVEAAAARGDSILPPKDRFYDVIFTGSGNASLRAVASGLHARVSLMRFMSLSQPDRVPVSVHELRAIVAAVDAGDADAAAAACSYHVEQAGEAGLRAVEAQEREDGAGA